MRSGPASSTTPGSSTSIGNSAVQRAPRRTSTTARRANVLPKIRWTRGWNAWVERAAGPWFPAARRKHSRSEPRDAATPFAHRGSVPLPGCLRQMPGASRAARRASGPFHPRVVHSFPRRPTDQLSRTIPLPRSMRPMVRALSFAATESASPGATMTVMPMPILKT